jgi:DNA repair protein RadC
MKQIREKATLRGTGALSDQELLTLLVEDAALAESILAECGSLSAIAQLAPSRLRMVAGMGLRNADKLQVAIEFGRRIAAAKRITSEAITSSSDIIDLMRPQLKELKHEECWAIYLTSSNHIVEQSRISQGGIQATVVDHRLIVKRAIELLTPHLILVHNHPSGNTTPSEADITLTRNLKAACELFNIQLLDHIIISSTNSYSFKSVGKL